MRASGAVSRWMVFSVLTVQLVFSAAAYSLAYGQSSQQVYNSLARSRDSLLDQRRYLQAESDRLGQQISSLQAQLDRVNDYMRDNDKALRDVEQAMRQAQ